MYVQVGSLGCVHHTSTSNPIARSVTRRTEVLWHSREEVAAIVLSGPGNRIPPARFCWLCNDTIVDLEGQVLLCLQ